MGKEELTCFDILCSCCGEEKRGKWLVEKRKRKRDEYVRDECLRTKKLLSVPVATKQGQKGGKRGEGEERTYGHRFVRTPRLLLAIDALALFAP